MADDRFNYKFKSGDDGPGIEASFVEKLTVDKAINTNRSVMFHVPGLDDCSIDTKEMYLHTEWRVKYEDGTLLGETPTVFPAFNWGANLWNQIVVSLNGHSLPPTSDYPFTTRLISLIGSDPENRRSCQQHLNGVSSSHYGSSKIGNAGMNTFAIPKAMVASSKTIKVYDRIYSDFLTSVTQLIPPKTTLDITLSRTKDSLMLCKEAEDTSNYVVEILSVSLFVRRIRPNPSARTLIESSLKEGFSLFYQRLQTVVFPCNSPARGFTWYNCFGSSLAPNRIFTFFVSQSAYFGSWSRIPNYYESAGISSLYYTLNGRDILPSPVKPRFQYNDDGTVNTFQSDALEAFCSLHRVIGTFSSPRLSLGFDYNTFIDSGTIFCCELENVESSTPATGSVSLHIEFAENAPDDSLIVFVVGMFPSTVKFDANGTMLDS